MSSLRDAIKVSLLPPGAVGSSSTKPKNETPAHWQNARATGFQNPWPSYKHITYWDAAKFLLGTIGNSPKIPEDLDVQIPSVRPTWGADAKSGGESGNEEKIKATWLGHACVLVELPVRPSAGLPQPSRGARILFDPVFSERCSPFQWMGPKRYTKVPCEISEIPEVDAIIISHDHYDHLDAATIKEFSKRAHAPHIFAGLGNADTLRSFGVPDDKIHTLDWWEGRRVQVEVEVDSKPSSSGSNAEDKSENTSNSVVFDVTCTPCQHQSGRTGFDRYKTLWASWVVQEVLPSSPSTENQGSESESESVINSGLQRETKKEGVKVYFAGDTGYQIVEPASKGEKDYPVCPAFKEIGERFGGFDFAMIPIGAYEPRFFMSPFHCSPYDSVRLFKDVRAKKALGMHWGTWVLTTEPVNEPPQKLKEECKKIGIPEDDFVVSKLGETLFF